MKGKNEVGLSDILYGAWAGPPKLEDSYIWPRRRPFGVGFGCELEHTEHSLRVSANIMA